MRTHRHALRTGAAALIAAALGAGALGCGSGDTAAPMVTEVVTVTSGAPSEQASAPSSGSAKPSAPAGSGGAPAPAGSRGNAAKLTAAFETLRPTLSQPVGISIAPVGGGAVISLGDQAPRVAWSTIKVPLALAAERQNGVSGAETGAIVSSDNAAAEQLWSSLGSPENAAAAVEAVLREGGDKNTTVPSERLRPEFSIFGQTQWSLNDAAVFTAHLPCLPGAGHVVELMGQVAANQQWGLEVIENRATAVKGGWGPASDGSYLVRQIGLLTRKDGSQTAFALSTFAAGSTLDTGIAALNQAGRWIGTQLAALPAGSC
nr:hypothetical protein [Gordonia hirsuta]